MPFPPDPALYHDYLRRGGIADLSDRTKLRLTGADRVRFLNGQVTADVRKLASDRALPACITTARGKLCAEVMITARNDALLIDADASLRESLAARLERYIVADDVALEDITESMALVHLLLTTGTGLASFSSKTLVHSRRFGGEGYDFFGPRGEAHEILSGGPFVVLDAALCEMLCLEAGVPRWGRELTEDTLPPEAGLDRTHIDYHKGCYIGQEVISRIKSVGHVNRELTGFLSDHRAPLVAGSAIFPSEESDARPVGTITSAAWSFALERPIALGYLKRGAPTGGLLARPADATGPGVRVIPHPLPFSA
jgi:folate-binding protein YgfZ